MKKYILCLVIALVGLLSYFLFEPIFVYNFGWDRLSNKENEVITHHYDTAFSAAIDASKTIVQELNGLSTPSVSLAVGFENNIVWSTTSGYADVDNKVKATSETVYRIGSVSKAVTSAALGKALENDLIDLDDKVIQYLPDYPFEQVTIRQLASHTSGIRNYGVCFCFPVWEYYSNDHYSNVSESLELFINDPLLFEPGTDFSYSSYNFNLLSAVLEKAYDLTFYEIMKNEIFESLDMRHSSFDFKEINLEKLATFYQVEVREYKEAYEVDNSNKWAGGGIISTPSDLVRLGNALLSGSIISGDQFKEITTPQKLTSGEINEQNYALGWRNDEFEFFNGEQKVRIIHHGGKAMGSTALLLLMPDYQLTLAIAINRSVEGFPLFKIVLPILENFVDDLPRHRGR